MCPSYQLRGKELTPSGLDQKFGFEDVTPTNLVQRVGVGWVSFSLDAVQTHISGLISRPPLHPAHVRRATFGGSSWKVFADFGPERATFNTSLCRWHIMIFATQIDNNWTWFWKIMQKEYSSRICRCFMIISGITFFIIRRLMAVYERYQKSKEITTTHLEELSGCFISKDQVDTLVMEKPTDTTSVLS